MSDLSKKEKLKCRCFVIACCSFIALGGCVNGFELGATNGIKEMEGFREYFNLSRIEGNTTCRADDDEQTSVLLGLIVSIYSAGSLVGALLAGPLSDWTGRRATLMTGVIVSGVGIVLQTSSIFIWMLLVGRTCSGLGLGILLQVMGLYIAEISPKHLRGKLITLIYLLGSSSALIGALVNICVARLAFGWRISFGVQFFVVCVLLCGSPLLPESPRWLVSKGKLRKAEKTLRRVYGNDTDEVSFVNDILASLNKSSIKQNLWKRCLSLNFLQRLLLGFCVLFSARMNGFALALYFSVHMFCKVGISGFVGGIFIAVGLLAAQILSIFITDTFGRKTILLVGYLVMTVCLVAASVLILVFDLESDTLSTENTVAGYFVVVFLMLFVCAGGAGALTQGFIITSEIFSLRMKGVAVAVSSVGWWGGNIISGVLSPFLLTSLGTAGTLLLHSGVCVLVLFFVLLLLPETKKLSLEQMDQVFAASWAKRTNICFYLTCGRFKAALDPAAGVAPVSVTTTDYEVSDSNDNKTLVQETNL